MKKTIISLLLFCFATLIMAQSKLSPYTRHFINEKEQIKTDKTFSSKFKVKKIDEIDYVKAYIYLKAQTNPYFLESYGVRVNTCIDSLITAQIPVSKIETISSLNNIKYVQISTPIYQKMNKARTGTLVDNVQSGKDLTTPFLGKDVVIGIVDNGFEYGHINFYNTDGTELRVKRVWNQNKNGKAPSGFTYGTEYTTTDEILAAKYDVTDETHATHVTGIAAGADHTKSYYGVAGEADIVLVSYDMNDNTTDQVSLSDAMKYIYDYAESVGKPCVINMSLGSHIGPHDGTSTFDQVADNLQGPGKLFAGAAGNEGCDPMHLSKTFTPSDNTLKTFIDFLDNSDRYSMLDIWGEPGETFQITIDRYNISKNKPEYSETVNISGNGSKTISLKNGISGYVEIYYEVNTNNNKPNAFIVSEVNSMNSGYAIGITITATSGTVHIWADDYYSQLTGNGLSGWSDGDSKYSVGEIGGTGKNVISVGAYATRTGSYAREEGMIAEFSSLGPTADGRVKPDITAPGNQIISSYSSAQSYDSGICDNTTVNGKKYYYGYMSGTSMATPFITGVLATWLQANPTLSPNDVRNIFKKTARQDNYTGTISENGNNTWGFGKIDAWNGIKECIKMTAGIYKEKNNVPDVAIYTSENGICHLLFGKTDNQTTISVYNTNGKLLKSTRLNSIAIGQEEILNFPGFVPGIYIIHIKGNNIQKSQRIIR